MADAEVSVDRLMRELGGEISNERRVRMVARGASAYRDPELYAHVEAVFRRVLDTRDPNALLLPDLLEDQDDYALQLRLRFASHRSVIGPFLLFIKRTLLLPLNRWLYEYSLENFRRQQRVNHLLFACIEELAIENATLRQEAARPSAPEGTPSQQA